MRLRWAARIFAGASLVSSGAAGQSLPEGPGRELVEQICSACHAPTAVIGKQWTRSQWADKVLEMLQEEPDVTQPERDRIVDYLARNFPKPVNVNKAAAKELAAALDFSFADAEAIVRYREQKGGFKTVDDLKKVPGLDPARIEAKRQSLEF